MSGEWLTYQEAAKRLGIKPDSAKKRAQRRHWPRMTGNDGRTRIQLPEDGPETVHRDIPPDTPGTPSPPDDTRERLAAAETEIRLLRERLADLTSERDRWQKMAERLSHPESVIRPLGLFDRILRRGRRRIE